jgi:hypothetical protein
MMSYHNPYKLQYCALSASKDNGLPVALPCCLHDPLDLHLMGALNIVKLNDAYLACLGGTQRLVHNRIKYPLEECCKLSSS